MALNQQSPGVQIIEKDASAITPGASSSVGATVGTFQWGPVETPVLVSNENDLVSIFGKPDEETFGSFFAAANFLSYSSAMYVIRAATGNLNATADGAGLLIKNIDSYQNNFANGAGNVGTFAARYPGALGNSITVSVADSGTYSTWAYKDEFTGAPGTSDFAEAIGASNDELHIIVIDRLGSFTGTPGAILEKFGFVSKASNAVSFQGTSNYYVNVITNQSQFIYWMDHIATGINFGQPASSGVTYTALSDSPSTGYDFTFDLSGGTNDNVATDAELQLAYDIFKDTETYDISLIATGNASSTLSAYVAQNIATLRKDCLAFVSISKATSGVVAPIFGTSTTALADAVAFKTAIGNTTYAVIDSGFKYQYDKYNDKFRWIALNADVAGLCARTDANLDAWISPAGLTKGQVKNVVKLAWNPNKAQRDVLYNNSINSVVTFQGQGTVLFGDKTATTKPSAFDRINVRRLFLVLEKSIANSAKFQLFELNDEITRAQFIASVEPFLRDVQGRRGIEQFKVICDETNNTPQVVKSNEFRGTILVRPRYSINFITLTFTAVGPDVSFEVAAGV